MKSSVSLFKRVSRLFFILTTNTYVFFIITPLTLAQEQTLPVEPQNQISQRFEDGLYFADVLVRGRPVFQIGSLASLSASDRASIINRRIAGILAQSQPAEKVEVNPDDPRKIATLQINNRVIMTVTQQDAQDFGLDVETLAQRWAKQLEEALQTPPLAIDVGQRLYGTVREILGKTIEHLPSLIGAVVVVIITGISAKGVRYAVFRWAQQTEGDSNTEILIGRLGYGGVWLIGSVIALGGFRT